MMKFREQNKKTWCDIMMMMSHHVFRRRFALSSIDFYKKRRGATGPVDKNINLDGAGRTL